jgi:hypothetical protein
MLVFERLWRTVNYEHLYLHAYTAGSWKRDLVISLRFTNNRSAGAVGIIKPFAHQSRSLELPNQWRIK